MKIARLQVVEDGMEVAELTPYLILVVGVCGHTHNSYKAHMGKFAIMAQKLFSLSKVEPEFGLLLRDMKL